MNGDTQTRIKKLEEDLERLQREKIEQLEGEIARLRRETSYLQSRSRGIRAHTAIIGEHRALPRAVEYLHVFGGNAKVEQVDASPGVILHNKQKTATDGDFVGHIDFFGQNDADEDVRFGELAFQAADVSDGTEDGAFRVYVVRNGGTIEQMFEVDGDGGVAIGDTSAPNAISLFVNDGGGVQVDRDSFSFVDLKVPSGGTSTDRFRLQWDGEELRFRNIDGTPLDVSIEGTIKYLKRAKTISSGAITVDSSYAVVDTEGGAASDDLDTINGGEDGMILVLRSNASAREPTIKHGTGNIRLEGSSDFTLTNRRWRLTLMFDSGELGGTWIEIARAQAG